MAKKKGKLPDPDDLNRKRAVWAMVGVRAFMKKTGLTDADGLEMAVMDLIADLAHLCDEEGLELRDLFAQARYHYGFETGFEGMQFGPQAKEEDAA